MSDYRYRRDRDDWNERDDWRNRDEDRDWNYGQMRGRDEDQDWNAGYQRYGDERDQSFQRGRTSGPGSMNRNRSGSERPYRGSITDESYDYDRGYGTSHQGYGYRGTAAGRGDYTYGDEGNRYRDEDRYGDMGRIGYGNPRTGRVYGYDRDDAYQGRDYGNPGRDYDYEQRNFNYPHGEGMRSFDRGRIQLGNRSDWEREGRYTGRGPKAYTRSDERIQEDIHERLTRHGDIDASEIQVNVKNGDVTLDGTVSERRMRWIAEDTIESVSGVREIHNNLRVEQQNWGWQANDRQEEGMSGQQNRTGQQNQQATNRSSANQETSGERKTRQTSKNT